jgi:hypothetical protein
MVVDPDEADADADADVAAATGKTECGQQGSTAQ